MGVFENVRTLLLLVLEPFVVYFIQRKLGGETVSRSWNEPWQQIKRIHLSTAILLMIIASAFVGMNCYFRRETFSEGYGWPMLFFERELVFFDFKSFVTGIAPAPAPFSLSYVPAALNVFLLVQTLLVVAVILERLQLWERPD
jgi:hypothetical protein